MGGIETIRIWVSYFFTDIEVVCDALQTYIYNIIPINPWIVVPIKQG